MDPTEKELKKILLTYERLNNQKLQEAVEAYKIQIAADKVLEAYKNNNNQ